MTNPGKWNIFFIYWIFPVVLKKTADQSSDLYDKTCNSYQSLKDPNAGRARDDCASTPEEIPAARSVFSLSDGGGESLSFDRKRSVFCTFSDFPCKIDPSTSQLALRRGVPEGSVFRTHEETCKVHTLGGSVPAPAPLLSKDNLCRYRKRLVHGGTNVNSCYGKKEDVAIMK